MVGETIGKYRIESRLGRGGMGTVYKGVDGSLGREVAIKCINTDIADALLLKRFRTEALTLARLNHPNIATLFELAEHEGQLLMIMEFVRGETLDRMSHHTGPLPIDSAARLSLQVLDALGHAHRAGVVHRDLKPANLMLNEAGLIKVMDFGLARIIGTEHLTNDGFMVGTPAYMAPEQVLGREIDGRADLYAMGVVLYRLLTGCLPFNAESGIAMVHKQISDEPAPIRQVRPDLPEALEQILNRALAKAPDARFQTADEFKTVLVPLAGLSSAEIPLPSGIREARSPVPASDRPETVPGPSIPSALTPSAEGPPPTVLLMPRTETSPAGVPRNRLRTGGLATAAIVLFAGIPAVLLAMWHAHRAPSTQLAYVAPPPSPKAPIGQPGLSGASPGVPATAAPGMAPAPRVGSNPSAGLDGRDRPADSPDGGAATVSRMVLPTVAFRQVKLLEVAQNKPRSRDAVLRLGPDRLDVLDGASVLQSVPYEQVISLFHSHSREPQWTVPNGESLPLAKSGRRFLFLNGADEWITVRTKQSFVSVQVQHADLARVITELEMRTGRSVVESR